MAGGRPKEWDRIQVGKEFIKWATNNPNALTVPMFAVSKGLHSGIMREWAKEDKEFSALFQEAKELIGINRLKMTLSDSPVKLDCGIYKQTITHYDQDAKAEVREEKKFESDLRNTENNNKLGNIYINAAPELTAGLKFPTPLISSENNTSSE